jgi:predicted dehydrogenase
MRETVCRWAILGASGIARKNWRAIRDAGNARLVVVASRDVDRAAAFIAECQRDAAHGHPPEAVGGYEAVLAREDVDAVYLPLPTGIRGDWAVRAAQAGKHVLVEKPAGTNVADVERIIAACRTANVQFMDGVMFLHGLRLPRSRASLDGADGGGGIGAIRRIASQFSFRAPEDFLAGNIRMHSDLEPLGCLGDLGWYPIAFALWALEPRLPAAVTGRMLRAAAAPGGREPVPVEFSGEMIFRGEPDVSVSFFCSFLTELQQWTHVSGTHGSVWVDDFVLPSFGPETGFTASHPVYAIEGCDFRMERHDRDVRVAEYASGHPTAQEAAMIRSFSSLVLSGTPDPRWPAATLATQRVMMACLESARRGGAEVAVSGG